MSIKQSIKNFDTAIKEHHGYPRYKVKKKGNTYRIDVFMKSGPRIKTKRGDLTEGGVVEEMEKLTGRVV